MAHTQVVAKLRRADVLIGQGKTVSELCKELEISRQNGYVESFNSKLRDELLKRELFLDVDELRYVADRRRMDYNHYRPHSSLDYMAPAAFATMSRIRIF